MVMRVAFCSSAWGCSGEGGLISLTIDTVREGGLSGPSETDFCGITIA